MSTKEAKQAKQEKGLSVRQNLNMELAGIANEFGGQMVNVRQEIIKIPRLKLTQKMSQAAGSGLGKEGDFVCELIAMNYGKTVTIIPIVTSESASLLYDSRDPVKTPAPMQDGSIVCRSNDLIRNIEGQLCKDCPYGAYWKDWGVDGTPPKCKTAIDVICLVEGSDRPVVLSFRKKSMPAGKALVNFIVNDSARVPFGSKYVLVSEQGTQDNYKFMVISPGMQKKSLSDEELTQVIPIAKRIFEARKKGAVEAEEEHDIPV